MIRARCGSVARRPSRCVRRIAAAGLLAVIATGAAAGVHAQAPGSVQRPIVRADSAVQTDGRDGARRPLHDFAGTAVDFGRDAWLTLTWPARMDRADWLVTGGFLATGAVLFVFDEDITRAALRNREVAVLDEFGDVGEFVEPVGLMGNTNVWYASAAVASWAVGWDRPKRLFTELLYSHWIAGLMRGGVNKVVGRSRPHDGRGARHFAIGGGTSFPSGHASTIFQVAAVLAHHADRAPVTVLVYSVAAAGAWERIISEQHWASDVLLGAAYGWAVAKLVIRLHEEEALGVGPVVTPSGGLGLGIRIGAGGGP